MIEIISRRNLIQLAGCGALLRSQAAAAEAAAAATQPNQPIGVAKGPISGTRCMDTRAESGHLGRIGRRSLVGRQINQ